MHTIILISSVIFRLFVGTYGDAIHVMNFNQETGVMEEVDKFPAKSASYIAFGERNDKGEQTLLSVSEKGSESGIYSFAETAEGWKQTGYLQEAGADACYVLPVKGRNLVVTADYTGASYSVFRVKNGAVTKRLQQMIKEGGHIHQAKELPQSVCKNSRIRGRYVIITDLGSDEIRIEKVIRKKGLRNKGLVYCGKGAGPRHLEFNEEKSLLYCLTELSGEVLVFRIGSRWGKPTLTEVQRVMADGFNGGGSADIHLHPSGKWLYTSHRLKGDGISVLKVGEDGLLEKVAYTPTGEHPRNFTFSPDGKKLLVACRDSRNIQVFDLNEADGTLENTGVEFSFADDMPVCLLFEY